jgi:Arc/MetJ-type ribon-helix-helix transcriptional regulator
MAKAKVAVTLEKETVSQLDRLVKQAVFPSRSQGIQVALAEKLERMGSNRLARECAKLDPDFEKSLAEEGIGEEDLSAWPEY